MHYFSSEENGLRDETQKIGLGAEMSTALSKSRVLGTTVFVLFQLVLVPTSTASLVERDWNSGNDHLLTFDSGSNLEWLDLTLSSGMSWNYVSQQFASSGLFPGFRYATISEVFGLFQSAGIPRINSDSVANLKPVDNLLNMIGTLHPDVTESWSIGLTGSKPTSYPTLRYTANLETLDYRGIGRAYAPLSTSTTSFAGASDTGSWLVRTATVSPVPEPETYAMFLTGLGLMGAVARRHNRK